MIKQILMRLRKNDVWIIILLAVLVTFRDVPVVVKNIAVVPPFIEIAGLYVCWGSEAGNPGGPAADSGSISLYPYGLIQSGNLGLMVSNWNTTTEITVIGDIDIASIRLNPNAPGNLSADIREGQNRTHSGGGYIGCELSKYQEY